ncbi:uncharacterized protein LOC117523497 [Thalassophryne amazonica]|uniref:uncharacterized protein LOC117523497 n=1 Tax=Thalassophryne amazonica TaxID=390379 RepID=UPI0014718440|nr:uncharacterized protein LOC117523497 [Thalassophryne amazonica]
MSRKITGDAGASESGESRSDSEGSIEKQSRQSTSVPAFLNLSPCAGCYSRKQHSMSQLCDDSSSEANSGSDWDSDSISSSSSSSSGPEVLLEKPEVEEVSNGDTADPGSVGQDGNGQHETVQNPECKGDKNVRKIRSVRFDNSVCQVSSSLVPFSLLPRQPTVVSTLHLQVLPENPDAEGFQSIHQHLLELEEDNMTETPGEGQTDGLLRPQPIQWQ